MGLAAAGGETSLNDKIVIYSPAHRVDKGNAHAPTAP